MSDDMNLQTLKDIATIVSFVKHIIVEYVKKNHDIDCNDSEVLDYVIDKFQEILFE